MNDIYFGSLTRRKIVFSLIMLVYFAFFFRLFKMQVLDNFIYQEKSIENSVKKIVKSAPRGIFYDRNYKVLVSNKPSFTISLTPADYDTANNTVVEDVLGVDSGYVNKILYENRYYSKYIPRTLYRNASFKFISWMEENSSFLPGLSYDVGVQRDYSFGVRGSHIFGYIKEISAKEYRKKNEFYSLGDMIGFRGLEKTYERYLRGEKGYNYILVDSRQKFVAEYTGQKNREPSKGFDIVLTIDSDLQKLAEDEFKNKRGAAVAMDPSTGEILAMVSAPDFDLSFFSSVTSSEDWNSLINDSNRVMFNRSTGSIYPPGSAIKMMLALIGLEEGLITEKSTIVCKGGVQFGDRFFQCLHQHGKVNVVKAIEKSCNTFFYKLALKIGLERYSRYARRFGFGLPTGVDIEESAGILPDKAYYDKLYGKGKWTDGLLMNLGIGQGELSVTPIQMARYTALLANFGKSKRPHLLKGIYDSKLKEFNPVEYENVNLNFSRKNFDLVREGMYKVVKGNGSAIWIRLPDIAIAGTTGTSQNPFGKDHAWFVGFAPFNNPKIALAVIVENVGHGGTYAAPIARDLIKKYLHKIEPEESREVTAGGVN